MSGRWDRSPCPCCGHLVHDEPPGSNLICPICRWEDDLVQLRWPTYPGGANEPCLVDAQRHYREHGASTMRSRSRSRPPAVDEVIEEGYRPVDPETDNIEEAGVQEETWPDDRTVLYWWRPTYWRRNPVTGS